MVGHGPWRAATPRPGAPLVLARFGVALTAPPLCGLGAGTTLALPDLAGLILAPGAYTVTAGPTNLSGTLTLDGQGNANAGWVFQMPSTLITSPNAQVHLINSGARRQH